MKIQQIPNFIFEATSQFFFEFYITLPCHEKSLFCTFLVKTIWFLQKETIKVQHFRLSTAQVKFHQIFTLIGSFCWKYTKSQLKNTEELFLWKVMQNLKENQFVVSKMTRGWWILIQVLTSLNNLHFDWLLPCKIYKASPEKVQMSYLSWHWRVMQNLKKH